MKNGQARAKTRLQNFFGSKIQIQIQNFRRPKGAPFDQFKQTRAKTRLQNFFGQKIQIQIQNFKRPPLLTNSGAPNGLR